MRALRAVVITTVLAALAGCGRGSGGAAVVTGDAPRPTAPATPTTAPVTTAPVTTAPVTTAPVTTAPVTTAPVTTAPVTTAPVTPTTMSTAAVSVPATPAGPGTVSLLVDVRVGRRDDAERIVFEFANLLPGWAVWYAEGPVTEDPSDLPLRVAGDHVLVVRMEAASGFDLAGDTADQTYLGPLRISPMWPTVQEVVRVGDFEAVLSWAIGVGGRPGFRVTTLVDPPRLVVDIDTTVLPAGR
jgi:hypothetical protein